MPRKSEMTLEQGFVELKNIVEQMEQQKLSLDQALSQFERGTQLVHQCHHLLNAAEQKIKILSQKNGVETLVPFEETPDASL